MARKLRVQYEGAIYHVTVRGVDRRDIFMDAHDCARFVVRLGDVVEDCGIRLYLFCLMTNHFHLVVETPKANLSVFMHRLVTAYTVYFNLRHRRQGHLVQGRFGAVPVQGDAYLLKLSRYVHLNPVFVSQWANRPTEERVAHLHGYTWSSYRGYARFTNPHPFVEECPVLALMSGPEGERHQEYRRFVETGIAGTDEEFVKLLKSARWGIGEEAFQDRLIDLHTDQVTKVRRVEDVSFRHVGRWTTVDAVLRAVGNEFDVDPDTLHKRQYDCVSRTVAMYLLGKRAGLTQRQIAPILGTQTGAAVSDQIRRLRFRLAEEPVLAERVSRIESVLNAGMYQES
jgi:REP element-mobilizing transposase RayT